MAATVYCQPIELRMDQVLGFDMQQTNQWQWRPDSEGLELGRMRCVPHAPNILQSQVTIIPYFRWSLWSGRQYGPQGAVEGARTGHGGLLL